jgi:hypothetical protein
MHVHDEDWAVSVSYRLRPDSFDPWADDIPGLDISIRSLLHVPPESLYLGWEDGTFPVESKGGFLYVPVPQNYPSRLSAIGDVLAAELSRTYGRDSNAPANDKEAEPTSDTVPPISIPLVLEAIQYRTPIPVFGSAPRDWAPLAHGLSSTSTSLGVLLHQDYGFVGTVLVIGGNVFYLTVARPIVDSVVKGTQGLVNAWFDAKIEDYKAEREKRRNPPTAKEETRRRTPIKKGSPPPKKGSSSRRKPAPKNVEDTEE